MVKITDVKIYPFDTSSIGGRIRAIADITIEDTFVIKGSGYFIDFPKKSTSQGKLVDIIEPLDKRFTEAVRRVIVDKYKEMMNIE
ncbi:MAG: stage V sporulation protein G [Persephonella sp.]|nr:MAG: stage V sporulation protein G [Persephonella sp.]